MLLRATTDNSLRPSHQLEHHIPQVAVVNDRVPQEHCIRFPASELHHHVLSHAGPHKIRAAVRPTLETPNSSGSYTRTSPVTDLQCGCADLR